MSEVRISDTQRAVLRVLAGLQWGYSLPFAPLAERTKLTRAEVRLACRSMKRKGLAEFHVGLWTEDGEPAGAGYCASDAGRALIGDDAIPEYAE